uniref:IGFBP N-terminal domain-containing protein n=1 Tax=Octopus bimaculoides TaxID=37653 RepID=A0A0L8I3N1_OCTBM
MIKKPPGVLSLQNVYIISTCFAFVICFSPPGCPCQTNTAYKCPVLPKRDCEVVYDYCGCCPQCALALGERCQEFGTVCQTGLICLWDRFWYDEPLSGKCWYRGYAR